MRETYAAAPPNLQPVEKNILIDTNMHIIITQVYFQSIAIWEILNYKFTYADKNISILYARRIEDDFIDYYETNIVYVLWYIIYVYLPTDLEE